MTIGLVVVLTLTTLFAMMIGVGFLGRFIIGRTIGRKHLILDHIVSTHEVPDEWEEEYNRRVDEARQKHGFTPQSRSVQVREAGRILRRLDRLVRYVDGTGLVADEATREEVVTTLQDLSEIWERKATE